MNYVINMLFVVYMLMTGTRQDFLKGFWIHYGEYDGCERQHRSNENATGLSKSVT